MQHDLNATAGPSRHPNALSAPPTSSVPPSVTEYLLRPSQTTPSPLSGTQDLLTLFHLTPLFDTYVRPYVTPPANATAASTTTPAAVPAPPPDDKGKGKQSIGFSFGGVRLGEVNVGAEAAGAAGGVGKAKKAKMDKAYSASVADIPGRNTIKKDRYLFSLIGNPEFHPPTHLPPLDETALRQGWTLKKGEIPGFDKMIWESEESGCKKKKKKRKTDDRDSGGGGGVAGGGDDDQRKKKKRKADGGASP